IAGSNPVKISADNDIDIRISDYPAVTATSNSPLCGTSTLNLVAVAAPSTVAYSWVGPNSFSSGQQNPSITGITSVHTGDYIVTADNYGCTAKDTVNVVIG